jgi:hypothetical protein
VIERAPKLKRAHADSPSMLSSIVHSEDAARAWLDGSSGSGDNGES